MLLAFLCIFHPPEHQLWTHNSTPLSPEASITSTAQLEPWEVDLIAFFQVWKTGVEDSLEREKAQGFVDQLDLVGHPAK